MLFECEQPLVGPGAARETTFSATQMKLNMNCILYSIVTVTIIYVQSSSKT